MRISRVSPYCLAAVLLLQACGSTSQESTPTPVVYKPKIDITRADYEAALGRWQAQSITEYEITTSEVSLRSTNGYPEKYRVKGDEITILLSQWSDRNTTPTPVTVSRSDLGADNTVEGLYAVVDYALDDSEQRTSVGMRILYDIGFDAAIGYVNHFDTDCEELITGQHNCPTDTSVSINVTDFNILSRNGTPTNSGPN